MVNATPIPWKEIRYPLYRRLGGPQGRSGRVRKMSPLPGFDPRTNSFPAHYRANSESFCLNGRFRRTVGISRESAVELCLSHPASWTAWLCFDCQCESTRPLRVERLSARSFEALYLITATFCWEPTGVQCGQWEWLLFGAAQQSGIERRRERRENANNKDDGVKENGQEGMKEMNRNERS